MDVAFGPRFEVVSHYTIGPDAATRAEPMDWNKSVSREPAPAVMTESMD
jgi:hypothetical protein